MHYKSQILRIIDANINRAKEGLRVCEDIMRLIFLDKNTTKILKNIRHDISKITRNSKIKDYPLQDYRDVQSDIGKKIEIKRHPKDIVDIFGANAQRTKEALRVLEELICLFDDASSCKFKNLRFKFYNVEKQCFKKIGYLCDNRFHGAEKRKNR